MPLAATELSTPIMGLVVQLGASLLGTPHLQKPFDLRTLVDLVEATRARGRR